MNLYDQKHSSQVNMHYLKADLCLNIATPITSQRQIERLFDQMQ